MTDFSKQTIIVTTAKKNPGPGPKRAIYKRVCHVCEKPFETAEHRARFCCVEHKVQFNNIRRTRGAVIYDFFMTMRYDRDKAAKLDAWSCLCALAFTYRDADKGKQSWGDIREHLEKMPYLKKVSDAGIEAAMKRAADKQKKKAGDRAPALSDDTVPPVSPVDGLE